MRSPLPYPSATALLPPAPPPGIPLGRPGPSRDGLGDRQARAEKRQQQQQAQQRRHRQRHPMPARPSDRRRSRRTGTLSLSTPASRISDTHTRNLLRSRYAGSRSDQRRHGPPWPPRHHSDALLLEIRWRICPRQSAVRLDTDYWTRKRMVPHINTMNFASERASTCGEWRHDSLITSRPGRGL